MANLAPKPNCQERVGLRRVAAGFRNIGGGRHFVQVFWGVKGNGAFSLDDRDVPFREGDLWIFYPGVPHIYRALSEFWELR